jgi:hypothetical protein
VTNLLWRCESVERERETESLTPKKLNQFISAVKSTRVCVVCT